MGLLDMAGGLLQQYLNTNPASAQPNAAAAQHFDQVAQQAPPDLLSKGLAAAFHSDQTPDFAQMAAEWFAHAPREKKEGWRANRQGVRGPAGAALGSGNVSPSVVQSTLEQARAANPSIVEKVSGFYAQHPTLIKTLGSAALT